jgi:hypothetical protein
MKIHQTTGRGWPRRMTGAALLAGTILWAVRSETVEPPEIQISKVSSNTFQISILNGDSQTFYEVYRRTFLHPDYPWGSAGMLTGALGQTTFYVTEDLQPMSFFQVTAGTDWDGDSVPNWKDAQPNSTNAGALTITIDFPTPGAIIQ